MNLRPMGKMLVIVSAFTIALALGSGGPAGAASTVRSGGLSESEAPYYLDVRGNVPPQFRQMSEADMQGFGVEPIPGVASAGYIDDEGGVAVVLNLKIGHGRSAQLSFREHVAQADRSYSPDDFTALVADAGVPVDQLSVTTSEWADVQAGDAARSAVFSISAGDEGTVHLEILAMTVSRGRDAALVQVMQVFGLSPGVDSAEIARAVATRVHNGPPSAAAAIAATGLITRDDLRAGWEEGPTPSSSSPASSEVASGSVGSDGTEQVRRIAHGIPQCKAFAAVLDVGEQSQGHTETADMASLDGSRFALGTNKVTSQVTVYPSAAAAASSFAFLRDPSTKQCLSKLYSSSVDTAARTAARNGQRTLTPTTIVTTPQASKIGDDRMVFRVTVEIKEIPDRRALIEQEFVRVGRAVGIYTFSTGSDDTIRDSVLPGVIERLTAAQ